MTAERPATLDRGALESVGFCHLGEVVSPDLLETLESEIEALGAGECRKLGLSPTADRAFEIALSRGGDYREALFTQLKNLLSVRAVANKAISTLRGRDLFAALGIRIPAVYVTLKGDLPGDAAFQLPFHQDYRLTRSHRAWRAWIALREVGPRAGSMELIPSSHRRQYEYATREDGYSYIDSSRLDHLDRGVVPTLRAGAGILFNPLLVHRSTPNTGERMKLVMILQIEDASALYNPDDPSDPIRRFKAL